MNQPNTNGGAATQQQNLRCAYCAAERGTNHANHDPSECPANKKARGGAAKKKKN